MNSFDNIQCDEFIDGSDFLEWVACMEAVMDSRDADDVRWDDIREDIEREFAENQPMPFQGVDFGASSVKIRA